jgi:endonuclease/exonuclease/phosphatase family metal-dependent hydrolase
MNRTIPLRSLILDSLLLFAFFSALTGFIETTYTVGLLGTDIPPEALFVLFLLSPLLLLVFPRILDSRGFALATGSLGLLFWAASLPFGSRWGMLAGGLSCAFFLPFLAARTRQARRGPLELAGSLAVSVLLSVLLRSLGSGNLFLGRGLPLALAVACAGIGLVLLVLSAGGEPGGDRRPNAGTAGPGRVLGLTLGLFSSVILVYFVFASPVVIARWAEVDLLVVIGVEAVALLAFLGLPGFRARMTPGILLIWNLLFLAALAFTVHARQPAFSAAAVYPLDAPAPGPLAGISLWVTIVLHPVIYADFALFAGSLHEEHPSPRALAAGFSVGALFLLLMCFAQILTTVYDYVPVIGPWFRNGYWLVLSVPGIVATLSVLLLRSDAYATPEATRLHPAWLAGAGVLALGAILASGLTGAHPAAAAAKDTLRVMTYNIQQGCGKTGEPGIDAQMRAIRRMQPDVLGLEETDTARIAGGNSDLVRWFADGLDMHAYYGPSPASGTFGVALLSRYPIEDPRTFFMASRGEQTAAIDAWITVGDRRFHVLVTHLDNDGALVQQRAVLDRARGGMGGGSTAIVMGDFNFSPSTEQYRVTTSVLQDSWLRAAKRTVEPGAPDPSERIDHIFISPNARALHAEYLPEGPSDHPAMFAEIGW